LFVRWPETTQEVDRGEYEWLFEEMMSVDLLVIDDAGAENDPWKKAANKLCQILSRREQKFTVITTNIKVESWPERFDTRIADRLFRNSQLVDLFGVESYSIKQ